MRKIFVLVLGFLLLSGCASCKWCKDSCKRVEYVEKAATIYVYPQVLKEPLVAPVYTEVSTELDSKLQTLINILQQLEENSGKCTALAEDVCDRVSVPAELMARLQEELPVLSSLYFRQQVAQVSNLSEAIAYYKHLEWRVQNYEGQILEIMTRESRDDSAIIGK